MKLSLVTEYYNLFPGIYEEINLTNHLTTTDKVDVNKNANRLYIYD